MAFKAKVEITGLADVFQRLRGVERKVRTKILRQAVQGAGRLILKAARAKVAVRTGLLRKSLGVKVKVYRKSGVAVAVVGPRTGFKRTVKLPDGSFEIEDPTNIAHLVEKGRRAVSVKTAKVLSNGTVVFGRRVASVPARPFLRPALDNNKGAVEALIRQTVKEGLEER